MSFFRESIGDFSSGSADDFDMHSPSPLPSDGNAEEGEGSAGNNPALVNPNPKEKISSTQKAKLPSKELLFFGRDFLVLNWGIGRDENLPSLQFLQSIFDFPHNDTNASEVLNVQWGNADIEVAVHYAFTKEGDELALIFQGGEKIASVKKISETSNLKHIRYKYLYYISFYGVFFALHRIGKLDIEPYLQLFLYDIPRGVTYSVSRLDLCADITNIRPIKIAKGVKGDESHMKQFSHFKSVIRKPDPETVMYGSKGDNNWFARIYDKREEMAKKGKERFYLDYTAHEIVTRLEVVFKTPVIKDQYHLTLGQCLDMELLFNIFCDQLKTKYVSWDILPFIKREMKKKGFNRMTLEKYKKSYNPLPRDKKFKRIKNAVRRYMENYNYDLRLLCDRIYLSIDEDDD